MATCGQCIPPAETWPGDRRFVPLRNFPVRQTPLSSLSTVTRRSKPSRNLRSWALAVPSATHPVFLETEDGAALQSALVAAAGDMPIVGPNCYGLINFLDAAPLWPDQHGGRRLGPDERGVAIVTQSSNIAVSLTMQQRGLPLAYVVTAGNQAQLGRLNPGHGPFLTTTA